MIYILIWINHKLDVYIIIVLGAASKVSTLIEKKLSIHNLNLHIILFERVPNFEIHKFCTEY